MRQIWTQTAAGRRISRRGVATGLAAFSVAATLSGMAALVSFEQAPGMESAPPAVWPRFTAVERPLHRQTLVVFVHPFCGCTDATISELEKLSELQIPNTGVGQGVAQGIPRLTFVVFRLGKDSGWRGSALMRKISVLPGAQFHWDDGGSEAKRFGAATSGFVLLYGPGGELLFHGGITGSRGHEGDNYGLDRLRSALNAGLTGETSPLRLGVTRSSPVSRSSPVFGCALSSAEPPATPFLAPSRAWIARVLRRTFRRTFRSQAAANNPRRAS